LPGIEPRSKRGHPNKPRGLSGPGKPLSERAESPHKIGTYLQTAAGGKGGGANPQSGAGAVTCNPPQQLRGNYGGRQPRWPIPKKQNASAEKN